MPARDARPANAEAVARAVHDYLTSVEERAQKAEVDAAEARIGGGRAARAARLTVALAGSVALAIALGGGGWYWVQPRARGAHGEQMRGAVEAAFGESIGRAGGQACGGAGGRAARAGAGGGRRARTGTLERARAVRRDRRSSPRRRPARARAAASRTRRAARAPRRAAHRADRDARQPASGSGARRGVHAGVPRLRRRPRRAPTSCPALERIRERDIAEEVALALDDWAACAAACTARRRRSAENLYVLAMDLDPDPERMRMRQAIAEDDLPTMLELGAPAEPRQARAGLDLGAERRAVGRHPEHRPDVYRMYDQALHLLPRRLRAAVDRRHDLPGRSAASRPRWPAARPRSRCARQPDRAPAQQRHLIAMRYYLGHIGREELVKAIRAEVQPVRLMTLLYPLVDHPQPARRDAPFVLETLDEQAAMFEGLDWSFLPRAIALIRIGDWQGAAEQLEGRYVPPAVLIVTPVAMDFVRGLVQAKLGQREAARESHARGKARMDQLVGGNPGAWEHSDVTRWRSECEAALGL
jgi:hypothetical protein